MPRLAVMSGFDDELVSGGRFVDGQFEPVRGSAALSVTSERPWRLSPGGHPIFERASTNVCIPAANGFAGAAHGVVGSGGALPSGFTKLGTHTMTVLDHDAESLTVRISGDIGTSGTPATHHILLRSVDDIPSGATGGYVSAFDIEILEWTGEVRQITCPHRIRNGESIVSTVTHGVPIIYKEQLCKPATRVSAWGNITDPAHYLQPEVVAFSTGAFSVSYRMSRVKVETGIGTADHTSYSRQPTPSQNVRVGVAADGAYAVLVTSETGARVFTAASTGRLLSVPAPTVGSEAITGIYVFTGDVSSREISDALDVLDPPKLRPLNERLRDSYFRYSWEGTEVPEGTQYRCYLSAPARERTVPEEVTGANPTGPDRAAHGLQLAENRRSLERFEILATDLTAGEEASNRIRSEVFTGDLPNRLHPLGNDVWVSYWLQIKQPHATGNMIVGQWHAPEDIRVNGVALGPPMSLLVEPNHGTFPEGDRLRIVTSGSSHYLAAGNNVIAGETPATLSTQARFIDPEEYVYGSWTHIVIRARLVGDLNGQLQWWRDGREIVNAAGVPLGWNAYAGNYFQHGIYAYKEPTYYGRIRNQVVMYSRLHVSDTSLLSHVTAPPARI